MHLPFFLSYLLPSWLATQQKGTQVHASLLFLMKDGSHIRRIITSSMTSGGSDWSDTSFDAADAASSSAEADTSVYALLRRTSGYELLRRYAASSSAEADTSEYEPLRRWLVRRLCSSLSSSESVSSR
ncbi:unnamed protein product [Vitrella brassicaformis CCMP3155]|uniref:Uncharacterized protein n=1 Tax=Vitrella brassicaformis (strain CCMP3155) TaxID=1169540 RepID=A0A0G4E8L0_VITBC|nr:unnamed protein product [Vitrella brassicaformis CCMP3155]|eukprot:CEL92139.1 unnamed protein product [Vitrella brassicaformis CCMP3155]